MVVKLKSINIYHDYVTTKIGWRGKQYISRDKEKNANTKKIMASTLYI